MLRRLLCLFGFHPYRIADIYGNGMIHVRECPHCQDRPGWR